MPISNRRTFLGAAAVALAGGVGVASDFLLHPGGRGHRGGRGGDATATVPAHQPAAPELDRALARERALLVELADAGAANPALAPRIAVLRADHQAHAAALAQLISPVATTPGGIAPTPTAASSSPPGTSVPSTSAPGAAVHHRVTTADLAGWEKSAAAADATDFATATGTAAALLASIYACEQTHVAWLS